MEVISDWGDCTVERVDECNDDDAAGTVGDGDEDEVTLAWGFFRIPLGTEFLTLLCLLLLWLLLELLLVRIVTVFPPSVVSGVVFDLLLF